ncbi:HAMP domain-containing methyl-accepting chemotaxis protein [Paenibacillus validus]|uniref:HAMP domain-containing protein n=1 Tax=Paenibacillus validus TaxID=44253 RepID=A0A7X3CUL7_9BACL|nr:HAMP domain-containing methyl-accepting chemotaxis protein [Paenibacillus validus]MED4601542.1 HAMP domain-containing methyl-accepting chemotaxis protein [Paenibacillus validus]MED4604701.1 HAMP domain-containing methyl-accepting chemotaxis protein [Paenibacillus validus]MUG72249.1 HAMP domain-containing protein [Paenibacillus validus]
MKTWFNSIQLTVGKKLYASFIAILILMCVLAWFTTAGIRNVSQKTTEITKHWMVGVEIINHINYLMEHVLALETQSLIEPDPSAKQSINDQVSQTIKEIDQQFQTYEKKNTTAEELDLLVKMKTSWSDYISLHTQFVQYSAKVNLVSGAQKDGDSIIRLIQESQQVYKSMKLDMDKLVQLNHDGALHASKSADELYAKSIVTSVILVAAAGLIAMLLAYLMSLHISKPVRRVSKAMEQLASGDLNIQAFHIKNRDEIGDLVRSLHGMIHNFREMVRQIQDASGLVAASAQQLSAGAEETSHSANQVSVAMQETSARAEHQMRGSEEASRAMEEMSGGIQRVAETSGFVSELAMETSDQAAQGNENIQGAIRKMSSLNRTVEQSAAQLYRLNERSAEIGEIVTIIRDIASQTGLLSLNASIEAARAGEQGRGFAVVANEVKKLAEQSNQSAARIAELVQAIQSDSGQAVTAMNAGLSEIHEGTRSIQEAGANFKQIVSAAEHLSKQIQELAASSQQMQASGEEVAASVTEMAHIAKQSYESTHHVALIAQEQLTAMEEIATTTSSLSRIADQLHQVSAKFKF